MNRTPASRWCWVATAALWVGCGDTRDEPFGDQSDPFGDSATDASTDTTPSVASSSSSGLGETDGEDDGDSTNAATGTEGDPDELPDGTDTGDSDADGAVPDGTGPDGADSDGSGADDDDAQDVVPLPFPCEDAEHPVRVENAGAYPTIQAAVHAAPPGGTILICPGTYAEHVVVVRDLTIRGAGRDLVHMEGGESGTALHVEGHDLALSDLTISGGTTGLEVNWGGSGSFLADRTVELSRVRITAASLRGIYVGGGTYARDTNRVEITECEVSGTLNGSGIVLQNVTGEITDTRLIENVSSVEFQGALRLVGSNVTVTGGQVHANQAPRGGGAQLLGVPTFTAQLTVIESDWGTGTTLDNHETDVRCNTTGTATTTTAQSVAGFLGENASYVCRSNDTVCCLDIQ